MSGDSDFSRCVCLSQPPMQSCAPKQKGNRYSQCMTGRMAQPCCHVGTLGGYAMLLSLTRHCVHAISFEKQTRQLILISRLAPRHSPSAHKHHAINMWCVRGDVCMPMQGKKISQLKARGGQWGHGQTVVAVASFLMRVHPSAAARAGCLCGM